MLLRQWIERQVELAPFEKQKLTSASFHLPLFMYILPICYYLNIVFSSIFHFSTLASQPYQGLSNDQVLRYVIDGGVMERPENCPEKLYMLMWYVEFLVHIGWVFLKTLINWWNISHIFHFSPSQSLLAAPSVRASNIHANRFDVIGGRCTAIPWSVILPFTAWPRTAAITTT